MSLSEAILRVILDAKEPLSLADIYSAALVLMGDGVRTSMGATDRKMEYLLGGGFVRLTDPFARGKARRFILYRT